MKRRKERKMTTSEKEVPAVDDVKAMQEVFYKKIREAGGTKAFLQGGDFIQNLMKSAFQALLDVEMQEHLGYEKHDKDGKDTTNSRNGKGRKKVRGDFGEVDIETPRDREGTFEPQLIKKRQTSIGNFSDKVVSLYTRGSSTRIWRERSGTAVSGTQEA